MKYYLPAFPLLILSLLCGCQSAKQAETASEITLEHGSVEWCEVPADGQSAFFEKYGFGGDAPFYVYYDEDGSLALELYYDEETGLGCGIQYWENDSDTVQSGFAFYGYEAAVWENPDPFSVLSVDGTDGREQVSDYQENYEYDSDGKLISYKSSGLALDDSGEQTGTLVDIIDITFAYRDDGTLYSRYYHHNAGFFGTAFCTRTSDYDEAARLAHTSSYLTSGSLEGYYIYEDDGTAPTYYLELENMYDACPSFYKYE